MLCPLAVNSSCVAASRTCPMLPGADCSFSEKTVWIESTTSSAGFSRDGLLEDPLEAGLGQQVDRRVADAEPFAARLHLVLRFLARAVEHRPHRAGERRGHLQQQRGLADPRFAAEQHQRAGDDAAAEHAVELLDAGGEPRRVGHLDVGVKPRARPAAERVARRAAAPATAGAGSATRSSTSEFHAPQSAQRPIHFGAWAPHSWQTNTVFGGFIVAQGVARQYAVGSAVTRGPLPTAYRLLPAAYCRTAVTDQLHRTPARFANRSGRGPRRESCRWPSPSRSP